ncbi:MAG: Endoribonuclease [Acidimicrobiaceae bacterium]|nr:Endoribonuclease [Acidimicrobiaceae bacterium]
MRVAVRSDDLPEPRGHFSQVVVAKGGGRMVFISGMSARDSTGLIVGRGDVSAQCHQVCRNLQIAVAAAGGTLDDIVRVEVYVRNMGDFSAIQHVRREYFSDPPPASTMVEVSRLAHEDLLLEITAIAMVDDRSVAPGT